MSGSETSELLLLVNEIVRTKLVNIPYNLLFARKEQQSYKLKQKLYQSAVLLFDNCDSFLNFFKSTENFSNNDHYLIYIQDTKYEQRGLLRMKNNVKEKSIQLCFLLDKSNETLKLITFEQFHQPNCREWKEIEVNTMIKEEGLWEHSEFSQKDLKTLADVNLLLEPQMTILPIISSLE